MRVKDHTHATESREFYLAISARAQLFSTTWNDYIYLFIYLFNINISNVVYMKKRKKKRSMSYIRN